MQVWAPGTHYHTPIDAMILAVCPASAQGAETGTGGHTSMTRWLYLGERGRQWQGRTVKSKLLNSITLKKHRYPCQNPAGPTVEFSHCQWSATCSQLVPGFRPMPASRHGLSTPLALSVTPLPLPSQWTHRDETCRILFFVLYTGTRNM